MTISRVSAALLAAGLAVTLTGCFDAGELLGKNAGDSNDRNASESMDKNDFLERARGLTTFPGATDAQLLERGQRLCDSLDTEENDTMRKAGIIEFVLKVAEENGTVADARTFAELSTRTFCVRYLDAN